MPNQGTALTKKILFSFLGLIIALSVLEAALSLVGAFSVYARERRNDLALKQGKAFTILCLGESTTAEGGEYSFPTQLERILKQRYPQVNFRVINKGMDGIDTAYVLSMLKDNIDRYSPNMVVAMMGINDQGVKYYEGIPGTGSFLFKHCKVYRLLAILNKQFKEKIKRSQKAAPAPEPGHDNLLLREKRLQSSVQGGPPTASALVELGWYYMGQRKYEEARDLFEKARLRQPDYAPVYSGLGWYYSCLGQEQAEVYFQKALLLDPLDEASYSGLAFYYKKTKNFPMVEATLKKLTQINSRSIQMFLELGYFYLSQGREKEAEKLLKNESSLNPDSSALRRSLVPVLRQMGVEEARPNEEEEPCAMTVNNYRSIREALSDKGIALVAVQYPCRSVLSLKRIFDEGQRVIFVDNEEVFNKAVREKGYVYCFQDLFAGDFGHCTPEGNKILAENIADTLAREYFNSRLRKVN